MIPIVHITYLLITPNPINKRVIITIIHMQLAGCQIGSPTKPAMHVILKCEMDADALCGVPCGGVVVSPCITFNFFVISSTPPSRQYPSCLSPVCTAHYS